MRLLNKKEGIPLREIVTKTLHSFYIDIPALRPGTIGAYAFAIVSVGIATALRLAVDPYVAGAQFPTFFTAIVVTTLVSGFGAGLLCAALSIVAVDFFVLSPRWSFSIEDPANVADLLLFGSLASYCVILISRMRIARVPDQAETSKDRLQLALDAAQLGWWQYDPLTHLVSGDARCQEIFDVARNEAPIEELLNPVHPDDADRLRVAINAALDPVDPKRSAAEFRLRRRSGEIRWVETLGLAAFEGTGHERRATRMVGTAQDITERKEREEKEHLLMREINHRAKNMLSVVDAIAHQTAARNPADFIERFSERIQALSANQDLLVRNEWKGVRIEDLACAQLTPFADLIGSRIAVHGPPLYFKAASAQAVGLALRELTTNAGKYGALSNDTGRLDIDWWTEGGTFTISWTERDGPPVSAPKRRGFGTIVMQEMAERSVDGKVDLEYAPCGVTWRLTCPAVNVLEPTREVQ
jgi:PAS domain S-box-containing protein